MDNEKTLDLKQEDLSSTETGQAVEPEGTEPDGTESDKVVLSKEEHAKLLEERDNYKKGMLSYKEKIKDVPKEDAFKKDDVLTKSDFHKMNEKKAIQQFLKENPELDTKWTNFVSFYRDTKGRNDVESILQDLDDAKTLFQKYNPVKEKDDTKGIVSNLSSDNSLNSTPSDKGGKPEEKGGLIKKHTPIQDWYKKVE